MKAQILVTILAALAAALGAGYAGALLVGSSGASEEAAAGAGDLQTLSARVNEMETLNKRLEDRIAVLEDQPVVEAPARVASDPPAEKTSEEVKQLIESLKTPEAPLPENFRAEIGEVVQEIRDKEEQEREAEREKQRQERFEERLTRLAEELQLNPYQTEEMRKALTDAEKRFEALREEMEGVGRGEMREKMTALREETETTLSRFLTPDQLQKYNETQGGWGRGFRGPGGGPGGGGPGGGAGGGGGG
ncbi:MAG: hypothetical protein HY812_12530 [Planctomycetes bacterium]|nr:hypothetical protein [Planctomycetota bacterium]